MAYDETNRGVLFTNNSKQSDRSPPLKGTLDVDGKKYWISAWPGTSKDGVEYISLSVSEKEAAKGTGSSAIPQAAKAGSSGQGYSNQAVKAEKPPSHHRVEDDDVPFN